ncbi:MAG: thioesterase family protein [Fusobacteriaceae bacterium]
MLKEGMELVIEKIVNENETAAKVASGALEVFSTPMLIAFMESTAFQLAQGELSDELTTVGTSVNIKHLKANLVGDKLLCKAVLLKVDGKKLGFSVKVTQDGVVVGEGEHNRYIINTAEFLAKLKG